MVMHMQAGPETKTFTSIDEALPELRKLAREGWNFYLWVGFGRRGPDETTQKDWEHYVKMMREAGKVNLKLEKTRYGNEEDGYNEDGYIFVWKEDDNATARVVLFIRKTERPGWNKINP